jgi:hypothetical protein
MVDQIDNELLWLIKLIMNYSPVAPMLKTGSKRNQFVRVLKNYNLFEINMNISFN